jgi:hypothetical protein
MDLDGAIGRTLEMLKAGQAGNYGYHLYPPAVLRAVAEQLHPQDHNERNAAVTALMPVFMDAAWELCRRGIVRPGVRARGDQAVPEGGYSLTVAGAAAPDDLDDAAILVTQPGSLAATFEGYRPRYGEGFHQRAQEAVKCRNSEAWLACCAMAGAAAESVLLSVAIAKVGNEDDVLSEYRRANGRQRVLNLVVGQANAARRDTLTTFSNIITFWRDEAAHGQASPIDTANADEALRQLLRMCQWVAKEWAALTA